MSKLKSLSAGQVLVIADITKLRDAEFTDAIEASRSFLGNLRTRDRSSQVRPSIAVKIFDAFPMESSGFLTDIEVSLLRGHVQQVNKKTALKEITREGQAKIVPAKIGGLIKQPQRQVVNVNTTDHKLESIKKSIVGIAGYRKGEDIKDHNIELNDELLKAIIAELQD